MKPKPMTRTSLATLVLALGAAAGVFAPSEALAQDAGGTPAPGQAPDDAPAHGRRGRHAMRERFRSALGERLGARGHGAMKHRRHRGELAAQLTLTDDQRRVFVEKARAAQPILEQARKDLAAAIVAARAARAAAPAATPAEKPADEAGRAAAKAARKAEREALMAPAKAAREKARDALAPLARDIVATLTPEQRARVEGFAAARGRKADAAHLERLVARMFRNPMAVAIAEAEMNRTK
jgi:hypothetical protein